MCIHFMIASIHFFFRNSHVQGPSYGLLVSLSVRQSVTKVMILPTIGVITFYIQSCKDCRKLTKPDFREKKSVPRLGGKKSFLSIFSTLHHSFSLILHIMIDGHHVYLLL